MVPPTCSCSYRGLMCHMRATTTADFTLQVHESNPFKHEQEQNTFYTFRRFLSLDLKWVHSLLCFQVKVQLYLEEFGDVTSVEFCEFFLTANMKQTNTQRPDLSGVAGIKSWEESVGILLDTLKNSCFFPDHIRKSISHLCVCAWSVTKGGNSLKGNTIHSLLPLISCLI